MPSKQDPPFLLFLALPGNFVVLVLSLRRICDLTFGKIYGPVAESMLRRLGSFG